VRQRILSDHTSLQAGIKVLRMNSAIELDVTNRRFAVTIYIESANDVLADVG
jgi:hypothetical protein